MTSSRVAIIAHAIDPLFITDKKYREDLYHIVLSGTALESYLKSNIQDDKIIPIRDVKKTASISVDLPEIIQNTDMVSVLKKNKIKHLVLPHSISPVFEEWARKNGITLIEPPFAPAKKYENKITFDKFLKSNKVSSPPSFSVKDIFKKNPAGLSKSIFVVQEPDNFGLFGTRFYKGIDNLRKHLLGLSKESDILIRKYLDGPPFGITIFIDKRGNYFYSACRRQCYRLDENGFPLEFTGVQWVPADFFTKPMKAKLSSCLKKLGEGLKKDGFYGSANFDFILYKDTPYILECNARLSTASPHLFGFSELTCGIDAWKFFIDSFFGAQDKKITDYKIPSNVFAGGFIDMPGKKNFFLKKTPSIGTYEFNKGKIVFLGNSLDFKNKKSKRFFFTNDFSKSGKIYTHFSLGSVISDFSLFDFKTGIMNKDGRFIYDYFKKMMTSEQK
jgi:hypothetical protein